MHRPVAPVQLHPSGVDVVTSTQNGTGRRDLEDRLLAGGRDLNLFGEELDRLGSSGGRRINADRESLEKGLAQLVLTLVELIRQLMERQALRRIEGGSLSADEVERLGETFMLLEQKMEELREHFELEKEDLNIDLGPLGKLL
jgi:Gas vesicle protein K